MNIPTAFRTGKAYPIKGVTRATVTLTTIRRVLIGVTNIGVAGSVMTVVTVNTGVTPYTIDSAVVATIPLLAAADSAGGPTSGRAMKAYVNLVNTTQVLQRDGRVYHLNGTARVRLPALPSLMSGTQWSALMDEIVAMPSAQPYAADAFGGKGKDFTCSVVDARTYEDFEEWSGTLDLDSFWGHIGIWPGGISTDRPMTTVWLVLEKPATTQQVYAVTAGAAFYTRWPLTSVPGQNMTDVPVASPDFVNGLHKAAELAANVAQIPHEMEWAGKLLSAASSLA